VARRVALTFDAEHPDRPTRPLVLERLLASLESAGVRATFFLQGRWVEAYPKLAARIASAGHLVGNHSHYHARMKLLSDDGIRRDVASAERVIRRYCGVDPRPWFRLPFGNGFDDARILGLLTAAGYRDINWTVDSGDWRVGLSSPRLARGVVDALDGADAGDGQIVLLHAWPKATALALPQILAGLAERGWRFVGVDELPAA
jgi:peptidoglycan/xylan/chitin deacetylase (PgdA/CDA1 family)